VTCFPGNLPDDNSGCIFTSVLLLNAMDEVGQHKQAIGIGGDPPHNDVQNNCRLEIVTLA